MSGNVFISWSGNTSKAVAQALRVWLPKVIQAVEPWLSSEDIDKGSRWSAEVSSKLEETAVGIICLTPNNLEAPWVLFEAGALSKFVKNARVCPYLVGVKRADVKGPLAQFQMAESTKDDTRQLLRTINKALGESALSDEDLTESYEMWWSRLREKLQGIDEVVAGAQAEGPRRSDRDILEEILSVVRSQARQMEEERDSARVRAAARRLGGMYGFGSRRQGNYANRLRVYPPGIFPEGDPPSEEAIEAIRRTLAGPPEKDEAMEPREEDETEPGS